MLLLKQTSKQTNKQKRQDDQLNRIDDSEINPHSYSYLILDKGAKIIGEDSLLNKWCWQNWIPTRGRPKLYPFYLAQKLIQAGHQ
jgi:hypothetical protein